MPANGAIAYHSQHINALRWPPCHDNYANMGFSTPIAMCLANLRDSLWLRAGQPGRSSAGLQGVFEGTQPRQHSDLSFVIRLTPERDRSVKLSIADRTDHPFVSSPHRYLRILQPKLTQFNVATAIHRRLLLWDCPSECDYACQHIVTDRRLERDPPFLQPVVQYHGKWPFYRFWGMQEPASVLFSLLNLLAHDYGMKQVREHIPESYPLRKYYLGWGYTGLMAWSLSMLFHARDFDSTEKLDYFAAGANIMYGLYYTPIRIFRLDRPILSHSGTTTYNGTLVRLWTFMCASLYLLHVSYLAFVHFDYTYNMAANIVAGIISNIMWTVHSVRSFRRVGRLWAAWPGLIVAWIILAMSLELFDFPPWARMLDTHALWHLGTVAPTIWMYK